MKLGLFGRSSVRANEPVDFVGVASGESVRERKLGRAVFLAYFANALGFTNFDGRSAEGRGENFGRFGFELFANESLDFTGVDGRGPDGPLPKLGFAPLYPALANDPGFTDSDGREPGCGVNFGLAALSPYFANELLAFGNVERRWVAGGEINLGFADSASILA